MFIVHQIAFFAFCFAECKHAYTESTEFTCSDEKVSYINQKEKNENVVCKTMCFNSPRSKCKADADESILMN